MLFNELNRSCSPCVSIVPGDPADHEQVESRSKAVQKRDGSTVRHRWAAPVQPDILPVPLERSCRTALQWRAPSASQALQSCGEVIEGSERRTIWRFGHHADCLVQGGTAKHARNEPALRRNPFDHATSIRCCCAASRAIAVPAPALKIPQVEAPGDSTQEPLRADFLHSERLRSCAPHRSPNDRQQSALRVQRPAETGERPAHVIRMS